MNSQAVEPVLDQQGMFYFNLTFDAGQKTKSEHNFGFRLDRGMVEPGENMTVNQLLNKPAVFNLKMNNNGLQAFELNGIDYAYQDNTYYGAEGSAKTGGAKTNDGTEAQPIPEATEQPKKKIDIPLGVIIGALIAATAVAQ